MDGDGVTDARGEQVSWTFNKSGDHDVWLYVEEQNRGNDSERTTLRVRANASTPTPTPTPTATPAPTPTSSPTGAAASTPATTTPATATVTPNGTADPGEAAGGEYALSVLRSGGEHPSSAPSSVRYLQQTGAVAIRYVPTAPLENDPTYLEPGATINRDELEVYGTRFGQGIGPGEYTIRVVFWQPDTRTVDTDDGGSRQEDYAADQEQYSYDITLAQGYDTAAIELPSHYNESVEATMWLEQDGDHVAGARWRFTHYSSQAGQSVPINSRGDLWWWLFSNVMVIAVPGLLAAAVVAKTVIRHTGLGPEKGPVWWAAVATAAAFAVAAFGYFYTAQLFARIPQLFGVAIVVVAFTAMLETMGPDARTDEFVRDELGDASDAYGSGVRSQLYRDKTRVRTVRRDDGLGLIKPGIRPFLARLFADPAVIDRTQLKTEVAVRHGPDDHEYLADPESEEPLAWTPAQWTFLPDTDGDQTGSGPAAAVVEQVNLTLVAAVAVGAAVGALFTGFVFTAPVVGALAGGVVGFAVAGFQAVDGEAAFRPAPLHLREARASIAALQLSYDYAKNLDDALKQAHRERARTAKEAKQLQQQKDQTISEVMAEEETGVALSGLGSFDVDGEQPLDSNEAEPSSEENPISSQIDSPMGDGASSVGEGGEDADE
jgi:PKD repeat protein